MVSDPEQQAAIDSALANLAKTPEGQAEAQAAINELIAHPQVELETPRYGGAFQGRRLKKKGGGEDEEEED